MTTQGQGPIDIEGATGGEPSVGEGRKVDPDKDDKPKPVARKSEDEHMQDVLKHVPKELKERVSKLQRTELTLPGLPKDREAYEAYLGAEKMIRDLRRRKEKADFTFKGVPKQDG